MLLEGKATIITGSGRGIGRAAALMFAKEGAKVAVVDIREQEANSVVHEIMENGGDSIAIIADVTKFDEVKGVVDSVVRRFGKVDILITNAGWDEFKFFIHQTPKDWEFQIALNLMHHIYCCYAVLPHMIESRYGKIVMCSSEAARAGSIGEAVYSACKGAVVSFMKTLAKEMGRYNINVNCVSPGFIDTPLIKEIESSLLLGNKKREDAMRMSPLKRTGKPEEVAQAYLFLASDEASFITGQVLSVNGGAYL